VTTLRLREQGLNWREIDGELVAVDVPSSMYLTANPAGAMLWHALSAGATREELVEQVATTFEIERERAEKDVDAYLADLEQRGLLEHEA
jgi:Coenzyme PQQ synthesis protein D (PqqD)